jgi:MFS family permease
VLLLISLLFIDIAASLPMGSLPLALSREGSSAAVVSIVMGMAMFAALFGSVPVGLLADRIGRLPTMRYATGLLILSMLGLVFAHGALVNGLVMAARSIAFVALFTAEFAYAGEIVSEERRVSSIATLGIIGNLALALGPALAVWLWQHQIGRVQFGYAAIPIFAGFLMLFTLPKRHDVRTPRRSRLILMRSSWIPALGFCLATQLQGGINGALAVLTFHNRGIVNGALLFTAIATTVIVLRYPAGRFVDVYGARVVAIPTAIFQAIGCVIAAFAWTPYAVVTAGVCLGVAWSAVIPIAVALFYEKSSSRTRGVAMGAYNFAMNLGAATGALIASVTAALGPGYTMAMLIATLAPLSALPFVVASPESHPRRLMEVRAAAQSS